MGFCVLSSKDNEKQTLKTYLELNADVKCQLIQNKLNSRQSSWQCVDRIFGRIWLTATNFQYQNVNIQFNRMLQLAATHRYLRLYYLSISFLLHFRNSQAHGCSFSLVTSAIYSLMFTNQSFRTGVALHRQQSLTSFSGLWKCLTIPLTASPIDSCIWPVFNSAKHKNISSYSFRNCTLCVRVMAQHKAQQRSTNIIHSVQETVLGCGKWKPNSTFIYCWGSRIGDGLVLYWS